MPDPYLTSEEACRDWSRVPPMQQAKTRFLVTFVLDTSSSMRDSGAALSVAVDELERSDAAAVAAVVLLTDGEHDPLDGSAFTGPDAAEWRAVAQRAGRLDARVNGYALSLRGETGAALLATVFPSTTVLDPTSIGQLAEYLDRAGAGVGPRAFPGRRLDAPRRGELHPRAGGPCRAARPGAIGPVNRRAGPRRRLEAPVPGSPLALLWPGRPSSSKRPPIVLETGDRRD